MEIGISSGFFGVFIEVVRSGRFATSCVIPWEVLYEVTQQPRGMVSDL